jgi:hypothetical protein
MALCLGAACGAPGTGEPASGGSMVVTGTATETTADTGDGTTQGPQDDGSTGTEAGCACSTYDADAGEEVPCNYETLEAEVAMCPATALCPEVTVQCEDPSADLYDCRPDLVYAEEALLCALEALRDGTEGTLRVQSNEDPGGIYTDQRRYVVRVLPGREAVVNSCMRTDVGAWYDAAHRVALGNADDFEACIDEPSPAMQYACLFGKVAQAGTDLPTCE